MGSTTCVVCTPWPQRHRAWCGLPLPRTGTRAPKPCAMSQLMKPWAQCHGLMAPIADSHQDAYAQHRGSMPSALKRIGHGRNAMTRCWEARKQATNPSHGHLDMARAHTSVWGRHTNALDAWSAGWCTVPDSEGLDQRHADGHPITRGTLQGRRQLVRRTL